MTEPNPKRTTAEGPREAIDSGTGRDRISHPDPAAAPETEDQAAQAAKAEIRKSGDEAAPMPGVEMAGRTDESAARTPLPPAANPESVHRNAAWPPPWGRLWAVIAVVLLLVLLLAWAW